MDNQKKTGKIIPLKTTSVRYNAETESAQNYIGQQIAQARKDQKLTQPALSQLLKDYGVSVSNVAIHKWEKGQTTPNAYQLVAISQALGIGEDLSYFISGAGQALNQEGRKKVADYRADLIATGLYSPQPKPKTTGILKYIEMPVSDLPVSAGVGAFLDEERFEKISFPEKSVPKGADFGVRVSGNSMEPVYHDGQIVWVQECSEIGIGDVGIFIYDGDGYLKVYDEQEPDEECRDAYITSDGVLRKQPVMLSYNPDYAPKPVSACAAFQIVGRVL